MILVEEPRYSGIIPRHNGRVFALSTIMRRYSRFSLRALLLVFTAACVWMGYVAHKYHHEQNASERVQELGGTVAWKEVSPTWLVRSLGVDPFSYVWEVGFVNTPIRGDDLQVLSRLDRLEQIIIAQNATFTGDGLQHLAGLKQLRMIYLYDVPVTDDGLRKLPELPALDTLCILATRITDQCLPFVERLPHLSAIQLGGSELLTKSAVNELDRRTSTCQVGWSGQGYGGD